MRRHDSSTGESSRNGRLALVGSGPDDPWTNTILEELIADQPPVRAVYLAVRPTGEAGGPSSADGTTLADLGEAWAHTVIPVFDEGTRPSELDAVSRADVVVVGADDPVRAVRALWSNPVWFATLGRLRAGGLLAAVGQAATSMGSLVSAGIGSWRRGLSLFPGVIVPASDALWTEEPGAQLALTRSIPRTRSLVRIEERTALVGSGGGWEVFGREGVRIRTGRGWRSFQRGDVVRFPIEVGERERKGVGRIRGRLLRFA